MHAIHMAYRASAKLCHLCRASVLLSVDSSDNREHICLNGSMSFNGKDCLAREFKFKFSNLKYLVVFLFDSCE